MQACDIDKLRDLLIRQDEAKCCCYRGKLRAPLDPVDIERQLVTYLTAGTTIAALAKCVEAVEREAKERIKREREEYEARERKQRVLRVCEAALASQGKGTDPYRGREGFARPHNLERDVALLKEETGDPYA